MTYLDREVQQIRVAVYGKDVRESIASGIEKLDRIVTNNDIRQNELDELETQRSIDEDNRKAAELDRVNAENVRDAKYVQRESIRDEAFNAKEFERDTAYNTFKEWYNNAQISGRLPVFLDGGDFTLTSNDINIDGGSFGDNVIEMGQKFSIATEEEMEILKQRIWG